MLSRAVGQAIDLTIDTVLLTSLSKLVAIALAAVSLSITAT